MKWHRCKIQQKYEVWPVFSVQCPVSSESKTNQTATFWFDQRKINEKCFMDIPPAADGAGSGPVRLSDWLVLRVVLWSEEM